MQPILHLTSLNPHVVSTIPRPDAFFMPRQAAPMQAPMAAAATAAAAADGQPDSAMPATWGVSAFAFQGTNAHALLALAGAASGVLSTVDFRIRAWLKERFWVGPEPHALLGCVARVALSAGTAGTAAAAAVLFEADLLQPKYAALWDHAVAGRPILPGAAFLEAAAACLYVASAAAGHDALSLLLTAAAIPAPLELPPAVARGGSSSQKHQLLLQCQLDVGTGRVRLASQPSGRGSREHMHGLAATLITPSAELPGSAATATHAAPAALLLMAAVAGVVQPASVGAIGCHRDSKAGGRGVDPACVDASFHLGALPAGASAELPKLRVPAAVGAYRAHSRSAASSGLQAGCRQVATSRSSITNDYWLAGSRASGRLCQVAGLEARALGRMPPAPRSAAMAAADSASSAGMLYEVAWMAAQLAAASPATTASPAVLLNSATLDEQQLAAAGAATLQQAGSRGALLTTAGAQLYSNQPAPPAGGAVAAGLLHGLLKAAALEHASSTFAATITDGLAAGDTHVGAALSFGASAVAKAPADVHGIVQRGGAAFLPVLLPGKASQRSVQPASAERQGAVLITGGTGTLGQLVALYLAGSSSDRPSTSQHISLLGRSGRLGAGNDGAALLRSPATVTISGCDAASAADAAAGVDAASDERQLAALLHAGGVLADALLAGLTAGSIRSVFAPKTSSLARLQAPLRLHPAAHHLLFSSVAALLGSPGQANYSAANSSLDAAAQRAQLQVDY